MKIFIAFFMGALAFVGIFWLDSLFIDYILRSLPPSASEWLGVIKVVLWILAVFWTTWLAVLAATVSVAVTAYFLDK